MMNPWKRKIQSHETKDEATAKALFWEMMRRHEEAKSQANGQALAEKFEPGALFSELCRTYRDEHLPEAVTRGGKPLDSNTQKTYSSYLLNFAETPGLKVPVSLFGDLNRGPGLVRKYLAPWITHPKTYNYRLSCLSRILNHAVTTNLIPRNPCVDVKRLAVRKREVYMSHEDYAAIAKKLAELFHEVCARALDWLYLISGRPSDMLSFNESQIDEGHIRYVSVKTGQPVEVERDEHIDALISWFRSYKLGQGIESEYLFVHPATAGRHLAGQPISLNRFYTYFKKAMTAAGLSGYTVRDLRPKALTDEAENAGGAPTNKGAPHTEQMRRHYVKKRFQFESETP